MNEHIKQIIRQWMENEWSSVKMDRTDEESYDDLADRIDKAIGIQEEKAKETGTGEGYSMKYIMRRSAKKPIAWVNNYISEEEIELEPIEEEKNPGESLGDKFKYAWNNYHPAIDVRDCLEGLAEIARDHFREHPEEIGLVRVDEVLEVIKEHQKVANGAHDAMYTAIEQMKRSR